MNEQAAQVLDIKWIDESRDELNPRLYAWVKVNGCNVHMEAFEVKRGRTGVQRAADSAWKSDHDFLCERADGDLETFLYNGKRYAIIATSFGA